MHNYVETTDIMTGSKIIKRLETGYRKEKLKKTTKIKKLLTPRGNAEKAMHMIAHGNLSKLSCVMMMYIHRNWALTHDDRLFGIEAAKTNDSVFKTIAPYALNDEDLIAMIGTRVYGQIKTLVPDGMFRQKLDLIFHYGRE
jgi:hypothetical protein